MERMQLLLLISAAIIAIIQPAFGADPKVVIKQTFPNTTIRFNIKTLVVHKDNDTFLGCVVDNRPADKPVQWLVQVRGSQKTIGISTDTDAKISSKYQLDKPADNFWRLKVQNVQPSDEGLYICRVQLQDQQNANDSRLIIVVQKPQIVDIYTSSSMEKEEGDYTVLRCNASGIPAPIITWQLVGGGALPGGGRSVQSSRLVVPSVKAADKGWYKCIASNEAGVDVRKIYLDVLFKPRLETDMRETYQAVGYDKELKCFAAGNPIPTGQQVMWYKEGIPLIGDRYHYENYFGSYYVLMKLRISKVQGHDFGTYKCYSENIQGNGETSVTLLQASSRQPVTGNRYETGSATAVVSFSITTLVMIVATVLLHFC